jgi:hypothetical protein
MIPYKVLLRNKKRNNDEEEARRGKTAREMKTNRKEIKIGQE